MTTVRADLAGALAQADQAVAASRPASGPTPSSRISTRSGCSTTVQRVALLCRITLVTPSRIVHANSSRFSEGTSSVEFGQVGLDLGGLQRHPRPRELAGQAQLAVALHGPSYVGQGVAREPLEVVDLGPRAVGSTSISLLGQLGLDGDHRQRVAEDVVQVAGEPVALLGDGEPLVLLLRRDQLGVAHHNCWTPHTATVAASMLSSRPGSGCPAGHHEARGVEDDGRRPAPRAATTTRQRHRAEHAEVDRRRRAGLPDGQAHDHGEHGATPIGEQARAAARRAARRPRRAIRRRREDGQVDAPRRQRGRRSRPSRRPVAVVPARVSGWSRNSVQMPMKNRPKRPGRSPSPPQPLPVGRASRP